MHPIWFWRRSKHEVWLSFIVIVIGFVAIQPGAPTGPAMTIGYPVIFLFAWLFAFDAAMDWERSHVIARYLILAWVTLLSIVLLLVLLGSFTTHGWSNR